MSEVDGEALLRGISRTFAATPEEAMQLPAYAASVAFISGMVSGLPVRLYRENGSATEEITDDYRLPLLNGATGDLIGTQAMFAGMIRDYFNRGGGYAFVSRRGNRIASLHYVEARNVSAIRSTDVIFHDGDLWAGGVRYHPFQFIRLLRKTRDGLSGTGIPEESPAALSAAYAALRLENNINASGGAMRGFLKSEKRLAPAAFEELKRAWRAMYTGEGADAMVLNDGVDFKETSASPTELQLNESKLTSAGEIARLFLLSPSVVAGGASADELVGALRVAVVPIVVELQEALNEALLLEDEKPEMYFVLDTTELLRGDILKRYQAYQIGLQSHFLQPDEVRYKEDMPPLGLDFITLGLNDVLYDVKRRTVYTPNTNQWATPAVPEARYSEDQSRDENGRFADEGKGAVSTAKADTPKNTPVGGLTKDGNGSIIRSAIRDGTVLLELDTAKQNKHIPGAKGY